MIEPSAHKMEEFVLRIIGINYIITSEGTSVKRNMVYASCNKNMVRPTFELISKERVKDMITTENLECIQQDVKEDLSSYSLLCTLIGKPLESLFGNVNDSEVLDSRSKITQARFFECQQIRNMSLEDRNNIENTARSYTLGEPYPINIPDVVEVKCWYKDASNRLAIQPNATISTLKNNIFKKFSRASPQMQDMSASDFILKVYGMNEYLALDDTALLDYDYIRRSINHSQLIELVMSDINNISYTHITEIPDPSLSELVMAENYLETYQRKIIPDHTRDPSGFIIEVIGVTNIENRITDNMQQDHVKWVYVIIELYHGDMLIADTSYSTGRLLGNQVNFFENIALNIPVKDIPKAARICISLMLTTAQPHARKAPLSSRTFGLEELDVDDNTPEAIIRISPLNNRDIPLGWVNITAFDYNGMLRSGDHTLRMWPDDKSNPIGTCVSNPINTAPMIFIKIPKVKQLMRPTEKNIIENDNNEEPVSSVEIDILSILSRDPLQDIKIEEKVLLWHWRDWIKRKYPESLPKICLCVNWSNPSQVRDLHYRLKKWPLLCVSTALELLDSRYPDDRVRRFAVSSLRHLSDSELSVYLLQLTQALKYESYHDSSLSSFLLQRSIYNCGRLGFQFFWHLRSEMHVLDISQRYSILLEGYIRAVGTQHKQDLLRQVNLISNLEIAAAAIKTVPVTDKVNTLQSYLWKIYKFPIPVLLPIDPRFRVKGIMVEKCRYMDSKKQPLWIVFVNADAGINIYSILIINNNIYI